MDEWVLARWRAASWCVAEIRGIDHWVGQLDDGRGGVNVALAR